MDGLLSTGPTPSSLMWSLMNVLIFKTNLVFSPKGLLIVKLNQRYTPFKSKKPNFRGAIKKKPQIKNGVLLRNGSNI